jgi:hypothetical protein
MSFPTYVHQLASADPSSAGALSTLEGWLKAFENLTGHRVDFVAALTILVPVLLQAALTKNPLLIVQAIEANLATIFPSSEPAQVRMALAEFHASTPLELVA